MKKEFLLGLELDEDKIGKIMAENGKDIQREKDKFADHEDIKIALKKAEETIAGFGDVEAIKADVQKYKTEAETAKAEAANKVKELETKAKITGFTAKMEATGKRFANDLTKEAIENRLLAAMNSEEAKGKSLDDLFAEYTKDKENIIVDDKSPKPPVVSQMAGDANSGLSGVELAFKKINPDLKI